jgi:hypothetical protein
MIQSQTCLDIADKNEDQICILKYVYLYMIRYNNS